MANEPFGLIGIYFFYFSYLVHNVHIYGNWVFAHHDARVLLDLDLLVPRMCANASDCQPVLRVSAQNLADQVLATF
jgi:hypothetical protein